MRIPMSQIQAATVSALPQQASREARSPANASSVDAGTTELQTTEKLAKSNETTDRDAQEQYQGPAKPIKKHEDNPSDPSTAFSNAPDAIWNLSVADDQPPPDLDIRG